MDIKEVKNSIEIYTLDLIDICPHCGAKVHIEKLWNDYHSFRSGNLEFYIIFRCKPCKKLLLKTRLFKDNPYYPGRYTDGGWNEKFPTILDNEFSKQDFEYISEQVLLDYQEALKCKSINTNRASCSMFRRCLQVALIELGADISLDLINQINSLTSLTDDIKDWAHQIRIFGNWGAHPDKDNLKDVTEEDVIEVNDFIQKFLVYTFVMPRKVEGSRKKREEKINK